MSRRACMVWGRHRETRAAWIAAFVMIFLAGCGRGKQDFERPRAYPVKGLLTMDGQPFGPVLLMLQSTDPKGPLVRGESDDKGNLKFTTNKIGDGVPAGEYKVYFQKDPLGREGKTVPEVYRDFRYTPLTVTVEKKKTEVKIPLDSKAEMPQHEFVDPTISPIRRKMPNVGKDKGKAKEKEKEPEPPKTPIDPKLLR